MDKNYCCVLYCSQVLIERERERERESERTRTVYGCGWKSQGGISGTAELARPLSPTAACLNTGRHFNIICGSVNMLKRKVHCRSF